MEQVPCICVAGADIVIQANTEKFDTERQFSHEPGRRRPPKAILAGSSACIPGLKITNTTFRSDKVLNMYFFNPTHGQKSFKVVKGTDDLKETIHAMMNQARKPGRRT